MGTSVILINSEKGNFLLRTMNREGCNIKTIDINNVITQNPALNKPCTRPNNNDDFWVDFYNHEIKWVINKYTKNSLKSNIKMFIARIMPDSFVDMLSKKHTHNL